MMRMYVIYNLERSGRLLNNWHYVYSELVSDVLFQRSRARLYIMHVLVGTYDLLDFRNLNGQAARRGHDLHFPRYQFQHEADRKAFQGALHALLQQTPLDMDIQDLMNHWYYLYERSIGCVGVLKDWLVRTVASSLRADIRTLTLARLEQHARSNAQCESMAADSHAAEQKLHYTESSREQLWNLLGMSGMPLGECKSPPETIPGHAALPTHIATFQ